MWRYNKQVALVLYKERRQEYFWKDCGMSFAALGEAEALAAGVVPIMAAGTVISATSRMAKGVTKKRRKKVVKRKRR